MFSVSTEVWWILTDELAFQIWDSADENQMSMLGGVHMAYIYDALLPSSTWL